MLIIDQKEFRVMSILHRTYRVTRLRVIYLLNTRRGVWEKITEKVSDETETFRRGYRNSSDETEKLFQGIPLSQIGSGTRVEILEDARSVLETSENFLGQKPEMFRSSRNRFGCFSLKKHCSEIVSECVQNYFGGYWNCSRHTEIIWDLTDAEKCFRE